MAKKKKKVAKKKPAAKKKVAKKKVAKKKVKKAPAKKKAPVKKKAKANATKKKTAAKVKAKVKTAPKKTKSKAKAAAAGKKKAKAAPVEEAKSAQGATKTPFVPIKVERRIIEAPPEEKVTRSADAEFFSEDELKKYKALLQEERNALIEKARAAVLAGNIQFDKNDMYDEVDQASAMEAQNLNLRLLDRDRKLLSEIDHALGKIETGDFGYCEGTGEPIPKRRLELRPWTRHSVKYKEKLERMKKSGRGVVDEDEL